ncbi:peptidoglycan-binding protein [Streptomyces sp. TP-A0356]|uniref:peptidoglycan-binding protein n=1 Tax=Streptomyces sp. TP-A0356 TaxID=1359208 RepID=UPI0007C82F07|nr:peptidoglycan-binding protein [Streptomyces sp. TP-A0356]
MGQWKPLADGLEPPVRRLVVRLRELKDQMDVSTTTLAAKTAYSRSSWERYLNGRTLPPRQAVEAISRVSGTDPAQVLALWEMAEYARSNRGPGNKGPRSKGSESKGPENKGAGSKGPENKGPGNKGAGSKGPEGQRASRRSRPAVIAAVVAAALAVLAVAGWMTLRDDTASAPSGQQQATRAAAQPSGFACHYTRRNGRLLAGHSADEPLVVLNSGGEQVVEVQCLLAYHGHSPGRIDGLYGELTEKAVKELQRAGGAAVDGKVGPQTWALLRT